LSVGESSGTSKRQFVWCALPNCCPSFMAVQAHHVLAVNLDRLADDHDDLTLVSGTARRRLEAFLPEIVCQGIQAYLNRSGSRWGELAVV
jgi:hypothetical protein